MTALILARALQGLGGGGLMSMAQTIDRRYRDPAGARPLPGLYRRGVRVVLDRRPGARRRPHRASALVADLLDQPAARPDRAGDDLACAAPLPRNERQHELDLPGAALMVVGGDRAAARAVLGRRALSRGCRWQIARLVRAARRCCGWLFAWRLATAPEPFLPLSVLANPIVRTATLSGACCMGVLIGLTIFVPLYFETVIASVGEPVRAGADPADGDVGDLGRPSTGRMMAQVEHYKRMAFAGFVIAIVATGRSGDLAGRPADRGADRDSGGDRLRRRHGVSGHDGGDAERGVGPAHGHRDRLAQLLPLARARR